MRRGWQDCLPQGLFALFFIALFGLAIPVVTHAQEGLCAVVSIQIQQKASLERQAFIAELDISNGLTTSSITGVGVNVTFADANGNAVVATTDPTNTSASFFLRQDSLSGISATDGTGTVGPSSTAVMRWLIIPAPGTGGSSPTGTLYWVGATLNYTLDDQTQTVNVSPASITVLPQPQLQLDYFLPSDVYADDAFTPEVEPPVPFTLGVRVTNSGWGTARNLSIDSAQPKIVDNQQGLLIDFQLLDSFVDDQPAAKSLLINFGDVAPQSSRMGRWDMETTLSGQFKDFSATFTHADALGGALTSLISSANPHMLIHDVLVDLPGRDTVLDFLARDGDVPRVYESDGSNDPVVDLSAGATIGSPSNGQTSVTLSGSMPSGVMYARLPDPFHGQLTTIGGTRSDGKILPPSNVWFSKSRNADNSWSYYVWIFDTNTTGSYTLTGGANVNTSSIAGLVFNDANGNGVQDGSEVGMGGLSIHLHGTAAGATVDIDALTDSTGNFQFASLASGTYSLAVASISQYNDGTATPGTAGGTPATGGIQSISLAANSAASGYTFAKVPQSVPLADLAISTFSLSETSVAVGASATLSVVLSNLGPNATGGSIAISIPSGLMVGTAAASAGTYDAAAKVWHVPSLANGTGATLTLALQGKTPGAQTLSAQATTDAGVTDPNLQNNAASATLNVTNAANWTLAKSAPATANTGAALAYTLSLGNSGQSPTGTTATVSDGLPAGVTYLGAAAGTNVSNVACTGTTILTCTVTLSAPISAGTANGAATFTINTTAPSTAGTITNYASIDASGGTSPPTADASCTTANCGNATTTVNAPVPTANFTLSKSGPANVNINTALVYTLSLGNSGQAASGTTATVVDVLPEGVTFVGAAGGANVSSVTCTGTTTLTCTLTLAAPIAANVSDGAAITVNTTAPAAAGMITNYAAVDATGGNNPPTPGTGCTTSNCSSAATTVSTPAAFASFTLTKSGPASVDTGAVLTYTLALGNSGQATSGTTATIVDVLPPGVTYTGAVAGTNVSNVGCTGTTTLTCTLTLTAPIAANAANGAATITINTTAPSTLGSITNYASVDATGGENPPAPGASCSTMNCGSASTTVSVPATLASFTLTKSAPVSVSTSAALAYTLSLGNSGQTASGTTVTITDLLPPGVTYVSAVAGTNVSNVSCTGTATLTCTANLAAPIAAGTADGAATITINTTAPTTTGSITNYASVDATGGANPPAPGSNCTTASCSSASTIVNPPATPANITLKNVGPSNAASYAYPGPTYQISLGNSGQTESGTTLTVSDVLPAGLAVYISMAGKGVSYVTCPGAQTVTCTVHLTDPLPPGTANGAATFELITYFQDQSVSGVVTNYASVDPTGGTNPPVPGPDCSPVSSCGNAITAVSAPSDAPISLNLSQSASETAVTGGTLIYTIGLGNSGNSVSGTTVTINDALPPGVVFTGAIAGTGVNAVSCSGTSLLTCEVTLTQGLGATSWNAATFAIYVTAPSTPGSIINYASIDASGGGSPPVPGSACAPATSCSNATTVVNVSSSPSANLTLRKLGPSNAATYAPPTYEIDLGNSGDLASGTSITVTDLLPPGMALAGYIPTKNVSSVVCSGAPIATCNVELSAPLQPNSPIGTAVFKISTRFPDKSVSGSMTNYASVDPTGGENPPAPGPNCTPTTSCGSATTTVVAPSADAVSFTLVKSAPVSIQTNGSLVYTISLGNAGQSTSGTAVTVADVLPAGVTFLGASAIRNINSVSCTGTTTLICTVALTQGLASKTWSGASFSISTTAPSSAGKIINYASIDASGETNPPTPGASCSPAASCSNATTDVYAGAAPSSVTIKREAQSQAAAEISIVSAPLDSRGFLMTLAAVLMGLGAIKARRAKR